MCQVTCIVGPLASFDTVTYMTECTTSEWDKMLEGD
jgi:hypothetical protein